MLSSKRCVQRAAGSKPLGEAVLHVAEIGMQKTESHANKVWLESNGGLVYAGLGHGIEAVVWAIRWCTLFSRRCGRGW